VKTGAGIHPTQDSFPHKIPKSHNNLGSYDIIKGIIYYGKTNPRRENNVANNYYLLYPINDGRKFHKLLENIISAER